MMGQTQSTAVPKIMSKQLHQPKQERTQKRMEKVIEATEKMIVNMDLEKISIPEVANVSGVPRASIYQFFPTKYDLLRHIALQHLNVLINHLKGVGLQAILEQPNQPITVYGQLVTAAMIRATADFYNESDVASILILSGAVTQQSYLEYQIELQKVSSAMRDALKMINVDEHIPSQPDTLTILIELVFTCMKHGYYNESYISEAICQECYRIAMSYLAALKNNHFKLPKPDIQK